MAIGGGAAGELAKVAEETAAVAREVAAWISFGIGEDWLLPNTIASNPPRARTPTTAAIRTGVGA
jgi:hypothetical protein